MLAETGKNEKINQLQGMTCINLIRVFVKRILIFTSSLMKQNIG